MFVISHTLNCRVVADYLLAYPGFHFLHVTYDFAWETIFEFVIGVSVAVLSFTMYKLWVKARKLKFIMMDAQFLLAAVLTLAFAVIQVSIPIT